MKVVPLWLTSEERLCTCEAIGARREEMDGNGVAGGMGGRNRGLLTRRTGSQTDTKKQAPLASACCNWQVVQAVTLLWGTTYHSNWIIYFCTKMLRWPHSLSRLNPLLASPSFWCVCVHSPIKECLNSWTRKKKAMEASYIRGWYQRLFCSKSEPLFFIHRESQANLALEANEAQR